MDTIDLVARLEALEAELASLKATVSVATQAPPMARDAHTDTSSTSPSASQS